MSVLVWLIVPFYDLCGFWSVAINSVYKLQFLANVNVNVSSRSLYAIARPSVCLSSVCNAHAPYLDTWNFQECFFAIWYLGTGHIHKNLRRSSQGSPSVDFSRCRPPSCWIVKIWIFYRPNGCRGPNCVAVPDLVEISGVVVFAASGDEKQCKLNVFSSVWLCETRFSIAKYRLMRWLCEADFVVAMLRLENLVHVVKSLENSWN